MLVVGNWKMNGLRREGTDLVRKLNALYLKNLVTCQILICPPAHLLTEIRVELDNSNIMIGGQDCHYESSGAFTGNISPNMLVDVGCKYVILGHSERRSINHENDIIVNKKASAAHKEGLKAIICIGETANQRKSGQTISCLYKQLEASVPDTATTSNTVIAYEPRWAIGSGLTPSPEQISEAHKAIHNFSEKNILQLDNPLCVLYGGSVNTTNAAQILQIEGVGGTLIGGASLIAKDFWSICMDANRQQIIN